jgi:hypothetical protein
VILEESIATRDPIRIVRKKRGNDAMVDHLHERQAISLRAMGAMQSSSPVWKITRLTSVQLIALNQRECEKQCDFELVTERHFAVA